MRRRWCIAAGLCALPLLAAGWTQGRVERTADQKPVTITFWSAYSAPHELEGAAVGVRRVPREVPVDHGQGHGQHERRQDPRVDQLGHAAGRAALVLARQRRQVLLDRRVGEPERRHQDSPSSTCPSSRRRRSRSRATRATSARCRRSPTPTGCTTTRRCSRRRASRTRRARCRELAADAKKLTVRNADGSIKVAGFVPLGKYYEDSVAGGLVQAYGARWFDSSGKAQLSRDSRWTSLLKWQKSLIDWYGYDKLLRFSAVQGRRVLGVERLRARARRDAVRRRVADGLPRERQVEGAVRHGAVPGRRLGAEAVRLGLHRRQPRRDPEGLEAPGRGMAPDQVPRDRHADDGRTSRTSCGTCRRPPPRRPRRRSSRTRSSRRS